MCFRLLGGHHIHQHEELTNRPKDVVEYGFVINLKPSNEHWRTLLQHIQISKNKNDFAYMLPSLMCQDSQNERQLSGY